MRTERANIDAGAARGDPRARRVGQQIAAPNDCGIEAEIGRYEVEGPLTREVSLRLPEPSVRADRARIRRDTPQIETDEPEIVGPFQRTDGHERGPDAREVQHRVPEVGDDVDAIRQNLPVVVVGGHDVVHLLARVDRRGKALGPVLTPPHRTLGDQRRQRHETLLPSEVLLVAEPTARVRGDDAHLGFGQPARLGDDGAQLVRLLSRRINEQRARGRITRRLRAVTLERQPHHTMVGQSGPQPVGCLLDRFCEARGKHGEPQELVRAPFRVEQRRIGRQRVEGIDDHR